MHCLLCVSILSIHVPCCLMFLFLLLFLWLLPVLVLYFSELCSIMWTNHSLSCTSRWTFESFSILGYKVYAYCVPEYEDSDRSFGENTFFFLYIYMYGDPEMKFLGHNLCIHPLWLSPNCLPKWLRQGALWPVSMRVPVALCLTQHLMISVVWLQPFWKIRGNVSVWFVSIYFVLYIVSLIF